VAKTFYTQLLTPEGPLFEGKVESVQAPGINGSFQMLYNHAPIVSALGIGKIAILTDKNEEIVYAVSGGFVEMSNNQCTLLAEKAELANEIDTVEARKERNALKKQLQVLKHNREEAEIELAIAENRLKIAEISAN
jgi:F-type H+-transporting ATPase subunit epsilon